MDETFLKNMWRISGIHLVLAVGVLVSPWFRGCGKTAMEENVVYVDLVDDLPVQAEAVSVEPDPEPAPVPDPDPVPPPPPVVPDTIPEPPVEQPREEPPPPRREPIQVSQQRVYREPDTPPRPTLSEAEVRRQMEQAAGRVRNEATTSTIPRSYHDHVGQVMYSAWRQPGGLSLPPGAKTTVMIRINRDGSIASRRQTGSSGNAVMDSSVMAAVESVTRLQPLPANMRGNHADISIDFVLTTGGR
jgi:TonB family protein